MNYKEYITENINRNIEYSDYLIEILDRNISYSEYLSHHLHGVNNSNRDRNRIDKINEIFYDCIIQKG
jgi:hypothetical protein